MDRVWYQRYEQGGVVLSSTLDPESEARWKRHWMRAKTRSNLLRKVGSAV